jgi:hypothetical protein
MADDESDDADDDIPISALLKNKKVTSHVFDLPT